MKLTFLGTRGEIARRPGRHRRHSSLLVAYRGKEVVFDCGVDWLSEVDGLASDGIVVTHAHPDNVGGLKEGSPCPVYATEEAWRAIKRYGVEERREIEPRLPFRDSRHGLRGVPTRALAARTGRRLSHHGGTEVRLLCPRRRLDRRREGGAGEHQSVYRDGASISRGILRGSNQALIGHASIRAQLDWCAAEGVQRAIFSHCGSEIVGGDERAVSAKVESLGSERGVRAEIAYDGLVAVLS